MSESTNAPTEVRVHFVQKQEIASHIDINTAEWERLMGKPFDADALQKEPEYIYEYASHIMYGEAIQERDVIGSEVVPDSLEVDEL